MRVGIRSRLIITFLLAAILPVLISAAGMALVLKNSLSESGIEGIDNLVEANEVIKKTIEENFSNINNYSNFKNELQPYLDKYNLSLQIINKSGELIFDSHDPNAGTEGEKIEIEKENGSFESFSRRLITLRTPIYVDNQLTGEAILRGDPAGEPFNKVSKIVLQMIFSIMLGLLSFFIIIAISTWYISKSILHPLQELNMAAENIAQGNLDYEIKYGGSDELGRFCQTFDLMRSKLKNSLEKQYAYEKSRQEMIASISHDLRTPISSVKGYVEGLLDGVVKNEDMFKRYLSVIKDKTEQLDRLIDDLSQFSNLELAKIQINPIQWECKDLFSSILGQYLLEFEDSNIDFRVDGDIPAGKIMADKHRLKQVFDNLIGNAKKYTGQQGVINCKIKQQENRILVAIADNGIGISNEDLPHIFDVFYRGEKSRSREYGGTGLGLAISKYIINAHGGEIWVESIQNKGSVFYFSLPLM